MLRRLNRKLAVMTVDYFGTMFAVWLCLVWALLPFVPALAPFQQAILYISAGIVQLVALPLLQLGTKITGEKAEARAQEDHERIEVLFEEMKTLLEDISDMHKELHQTLNISKEILNEETADHHDGAAGFDPYGVCSEEVERRLGE